MPIPRRLVLVWLAALVCAAGQAAGSLKADLEAVFAAPGLVNTSALVETLEGETLYERLPDRPMIPASNMKLATCATALRTWGELSRLPGRCYAAAFKATVSDGQCAPQSTLALLRDMDKVSSNRLADSFMRALMLTHSAGSYDDLMHEAWRHLGLPLEGCVFVDGSGLSRENRLTPRFLVALLRHMRTESDQAGAFVHTLPVAALDGTLKTRMGGTCAAGTVRAKTGFLTGVCALSGYVDRNGKRLVFSMMMNGHTADGDVIRAVQNKACVVMVRSCGP